MKLLLDTHTFLWFVSNDARLSAKAAAAIEDEETACFLSIASAWELSIKVSLGKLVLAQPLDQFLPTQLDLNGIQLLGLSLAHTLKVAELPFHHRDPFDRLLVAQAEEEQMLLVSADELFERYTARRLW